MFFSKRALIESNETLYLNLIVIIVPLLNFLAGISFDLYAPSMPAIAKALQTSTLAIKNTITITMLGFALGSLMLGVLIDRFGRRTIIVPALFLYILVSVLGASVSSVQQLLAVRFLQGIFTAAASIGARAMVMDYFTGKRFFVVILYMSIAYGLGLVIGPFFGGYLQYHFGWQANFYAYALIAAFIEVIMIVWVHESLANPSTNSLWEMTKFYLPIIIHPVFLAGTFILGIVLIEQLIYPTLGVFIVQNTLHYNAIQYGNTALLVGLSYLIGTLCNRILLEWLSALNLILVGFGILAGAVFLQFIVSIQPLTLMTLLSPIILFNFGLGFLFGNVVGICLQLFPKNAGMNTAIQSCLFMALSAFGIFVISHLKVENVQTLAWIFLSLLLLQLLAYGALKNKDYSCVK